MTDYEFCACGRVVDEFEKFCHWCKRPKPATETDQDKFEGENDKQMRLFDD